MDNKIEMIKERAMVLMSEAGMLRETMDEMSEWNSVGEIITNVKSVHKYLVRVVRFIQQAAKELGEEFETSENKLEAAASIVDDMLDLPFYLEMIDGPVIKVVLSLVVSFVKDKYGDWDFDLLDKHFG